MEVYIVGEDAVTKAIIRRLLAYCSPDFVVIEELPARGGEIKQKIPNFNQLSEKHPVVLLMDLDNNGCAPQLRQKLLTEGIQKNDDFIFNIAVDEAEAWLMADREGFARYFKIPIDKMPSPHQTKQGGMRAFTEMAFSYKSSMYLTRELTSYMGNREYVEQLTPKQGAAKGPEYNSCILPFINGAWDIGKACKNADSLGRMVLRLQKLGGKGRVIGWFWTKIPLRGGERKGRVG
jgi:hypothetical protein